MASPMAERFMEALQQAERTGDVEALVVLFSDAAEFTNLASPTPLQGGEGARHFWQQYLGVFQQIHSQFEQVIEGDGVIVLEWHSEGVLKSGTPLSYRGVSILEIRDGHIHRFRTYYDSAVFLPQGAKLRGQQPSQGVGEDARSHKTAGVSRP